MAYNVLLVDDSSVLRKMVIKILLLSGIPIEAIFQAENGKEGLEILKRKKIDIALVDINMPVMGGDEMVQEMRQDSIFSKIPVIFISSESSSIRIEMLMKNGAGFIHKPFTPEVLRENILLALGEGQGNG